MRPDLREKLGKEWIFCDGATGTYLQSRGLKGGELPELWNLTHPDIITDLYTGFLAAGCNIFNANTFGANALKYPDQLEEIITAGIRLAVDARKAAGREEDAWVALDVGPTGKLLEPLGDLSFENAVELFAQVVRIGAAAGADLVLIETMNDTYELKAAMLAAKENPAGSGDHNLRPQRTASDRRAGGGGGAAFGEPSCGRTGGELLFGTA